MRIDYIKYTTLEEAPEEVVATEEKGLPSIGILMLLLAKKTQTEDAEPTDTIALRVPTRSKEAGFEYITVNTGVDLEPGATYKYSFDLWFTQDISDPACADPTTTYHYSTNKLRGVRTLIIGATLTNHNNVATWPFPEAMFRRELEAGKVMTVSSRFTVSEDQAAGTELALRIRKDNGEYSRGELMIDNIKIWKDGSEEYIVNETFAEGVLPEYITANAEGVELIDLGDGTSIPSEKPEDETPVEVSSVTYNFDTDEGWTKADGVTYDGNAHLKVTSTTILNVAKAVEAAENYTLEFRAKMTTRGNQCGIKLTQATHRLLFMFVPGQFLIAGGEMQMLDTSEMHTYKIVVTGSKNATVYVDGKEIAKQELQASAGGPAITMFAQGAADGTASEIYVDYIKYSVNE